MSSLANKYWTDTSVLPSDILSLQGYDFFKIVTSLTCEDVTDILRIQAIRNVRVFMLVSDVLAVLKLDCSELESIKHRACFHLVDGTYIVKIGIELSFRYLRDLFATKIREFHSSNNQQQQSQMNNNNDTITSDNDQHNLSFGQKRSATFSEQISNKRGRK